MGQGAAALLASAGRGPGSAPATTPTGGRSSTSATTPTGGTSAATTASGERATSAPATPSAADALILAGSERRGPG